MSLGTQAEARVPAEAVHRQVGYLHRLRERMEEAGRRDDPLYAKVCAAHDAVHGLWRISATAAAGWTGRRLSRT